jgi:hypothetical protein
MQALLLKVAAALALVAAIVGLSLGLLATRETLSDTRTQLDEQKTAVAALRDAQARTAARVLQVQRVSNQTRDSVKAAWDSNPSSRDASVPADVAQRLCERLSCTP